jgi:hypothetical protein
MQTVPIEDTTSRVSFFRDDTIDVVRQHVALAVNSHPDRLFIEARVKLPKNYYGSNPKNFMELFFRMALNRARVTPDTVRRYNELSSIRIPVREYSELDWEERHEDLGPLLDPENDFYEWRILGVDAATSLVMPLPPAALPDYAGVAPLPKLQSLLETQHPQEITQFRVTEITEDTLETVRRNYFPFFTPRETPINIESMRSAIRGSQTQLQRLLNLNAPKHQKVSILRAKWIVPLISTRFTAPRNRFEQIFYGLTVSEATPYVGYFTAKTETTRHKFYVENPKNKVVPDEFKAMWKAWTNKTQPQRRRPTLLFYRGTGRTNFDRIAITDKDIIFSAERTKDSEQTLEDIRASMEEWFQTLDAVTPFIVPTDMDKSRWELDTLSVISNYTKSVKEFDMRRFACLQNLFSYYKDSFRLLRTEHTSDDISPLEIQAYQVLNQSDVDPSAELLRTELGLSASDAQALYSKILSLGETFDIEKAARAYPVVRFSGTEVIVNFVTNLERTLEYADILRYVLSSDAEEVNEVCPPRLEAVAPVVSVQQQEFSEEEYDSSNDDFFAGLGLDEPPAAPVEEPAPAAAGESVRAERRLTVAQKSASTFSYFINRLQKFDPKTFDKSYPGECERTRQVVVLTADQQDRMGDDYNYSTRPDSEKLVLSDPDGLAVCPPYWCIRDELPLREDQLVTGDDDALHCPVCNGKIRTGDTDDPTEFTVIERKTTMIYPDLMKSVSATNKRRLPCCYQSPRPDATVGHTKREGKAYVLGLERSRLPSLRFAFLEEDLAAKLRLKTNYGTTVRAGRLVTGSEDFFRIGLGRPSETLPKLLKDATEIKRPNNAKDNVTKCSFFRTWTQMGTGETQLDKVVDGIDQVYMAGDLPVLDELEYVTTFLKCEVIRIDPKTSEVICGFWSETAGPKTKTLVMVGDDLLGVVNRRERAARPESLQYVVNLRDKKFGETRDLLRNAHSEACASNVPTFRETIDKELLPKGKTDYRAILDPYDRIQAILIPKEVILPVQPVARAPPSGIRSLQYHEIPEGDIPSGAKARAFFAATVLPGHKIRGEMRNVEGEVVEFLLASGFRSPIRAESPDPSIPAAEVTETVRANEEETLVEGEVNEEDAKIARDTAYASEIYEFLLYSISKDIQSEDDAELRAAIEAQDKNIMKPLKRWFKKAAYVKSTASPTDFVNKVRKPCGQFKDKPEQCKASNLCGWVKVKTSDGEKKTCKIRVSGTADTDEILRRLARDLTRNDKLRGLVLDDRLSPFFSTILYLEMPHELITTTV